MEGHHQQQQLHELLSNQQAHNAYMLAKANPMTTFREDQGQKRLMNETDRVIGYVPDNLK